MHDVADLLERERHRPDRHRSGHNCAAGCGSKVYVPGMTLCGRCKRRSVNLSVDQRDDGRVTHVSGAA